MVDPCSPSIVAVASPIPPAAPVTIATLPENSMFISPSLLVHPSAVFLICVPFLPLHPLIKNRTNCDALFLILCCLSIISLMDKMLCCHTSISHSGKYCFPNKPAVSCKKCLILQKYPKQEELVNILIFRIGSPNYSLAGKFRFCMHPQRPSDYLKANQGSG